MEWLLHHAVRARAEEGPDREALVYADERWTWSELDRRVTGVAKGLRGLGIERGDRVAVYAGPSTGQVAALLGASRAGATFVPVHPSLFPDQVAHVLDDCGVRALVTDRRRLDRAREAADASPTVEAIVSIGEKSEIDPTGGRPIHRLEAWIEADPGGALDDPGIGLDLAAILYTSGSTGRPKGVMVTHENLLAGGRIVADYLGIGADDRTLVALPFSFDAGLNQLVTGVCRGATVVLLDFLHGRQVVRALVEERITGLAGVPTLWSLVARSGSGLAEREVPELRYVTNTGGALPRRVLAALREALPGVRVYLMYGLTEAFRSTYLPPEEIDRRPTSIGKAIPETEILVVDQEGRPCGPGEVGELVHRGPTVSPGYWGRPEDTDRVFRPPPLSPPGRGDDERACWSGDLVRRDEEGFLHFVGRRDNLIKSMGFRVSPTEVEAVLCRHDRVEQAAVVGIADEVRGQRIVAFVTGPDPDDDVGEIVAHCAEHAPPHMVPAEVRVIEALPETTSGKVDYPALRGRVA